MIDELAVSNVGLLDEARIEPGPGFVAVTGETGAGKTMLLGAVRLLSGEPVSRHLIGPHGDEATVEARIVGEEEFVVRRRIAADGRGRAYLDGTMVPARVLAERVSPHIAIVAQGNQIAVTSPGEARRMLDASLDPSGMQALADYAEAWELLHRLRRDRSTVSDDPGAIERERDMAAFQADEIASAAFAVGEDEKLEVSVRRLRHAEEISERLAAAYEALTGRGGAEVLLGEARAHLGHVAELDPTLDPTVEASEEAAAIVSELSAVVAGTLHGLASDPGRLDDVEQRVALLRTLQRKYGPTLEDVLAAGQRAITRVEELDALVERAASIAAEVAAAEERASATASRLRQARSHAAERVAAAAEAQLSELGFRDPAVQFRVSPAEPGPAGGDRIELLFASDAGLDLHPVSKTASGGELSRLVLALRLATGTGDAPIVAFDEVDAGVGGGTALAMGAKLARLGQGRQVLCVTHLPQVAAFADTHFVVERNGTTARVCRVEGDARVAEVARMLGGLPDSERGRDHAAELLARVGPQPG